MNARRKGKLGRTLGRMIEALESRTLLSSYTPVKLAVFQVYGDPVGPLISDSAGDLFGVTREGGTNHAGSVFELPAGASQITTLASFGATSSSGGSVYPNPIVLDASGDIFGTTEEGGNAGNDTGMIYEVVKGSGTIKILASFDADNTSNVSGAYPEGNTYLDSNGDLFGTASADGTYVDQSGGGTWWELPAGSGTIDVLQTFQTPEGIIINQHPTFTTQDSAGDIFGIAQQQAKVGYYGFVWEIPANGGTIETLATFNGSNGSEPYGPIALDSAGDLFGTTLYGGPGQVGYSESGDGVIWEVKAGSGAITDVADFSIATGINPSGVTMDASGNLFGTAFSGGSATPADGTAWELPAGSSTISPLVAFGPAISGRTPNDALLLGANGNLFGTTSNAGDAKDVDGGTVFELAAPGNAIPGGVAILNPTVSHTTLPSAVVAGGASKGTATVKITNSGTIAESGTGTVSVYASLNGVVDSSSVLLGSVSKNLAIRAGATSSVSVPIKSVPIGLDGAYALLAQTTDASGATGQATTGPTVTIAPAFLSFAESAFKTTLTPAAVSGQTTKATVQFKITNNGNITSSGATTIAVYASTAGTAAGGTLIATLPTKVVLKPGASKVVKVPLKAIPAVADGSYQLVAQVTDPLNNITAIASGTAYTLAAPFTAYTVAINSFSPASWSLSTPTKVTMSVTIDNTGNIAMGDPHNVDAIIIAPGIESADGLTTIRELYEIATRSPVLAAGKSVTVNFRFSANLADTTLKLTAGTYFPIVDVQLSTPMTNVETESTTAVSVG